MLLKITSDDIITFGIIAFVSLIGITVVSLILSYSIKGKEKLKEKFVKRGKILSIKLSQANIQWYVVEFDDGERTELRNFHANKLIVTEGDYGDITYQGKTIVKFDLIK